MQRAAPIHRGLTGGVGIGNALFPDDGFVVTDDTGARAGSAEIKAEVIADDASFNDRRMATTAIRIILILSLIFPTLRAGTTYSISTSKGK